MYTFYIVLAIKLPFLEFEPQYSCSISLDKYLIAAQFHHSVDRVI